MALERHLKNNQNIMKKVISAVFGKQNFLRITLPIILVVILAVIGLFSFRQPNVSLTPDAAKAKAETFVNSFLMQGGNKATIQDISEAYGMYKLKINIVSDTVESYITKDGKLFFPQALDIDQITSGGKTAGTSAAAAPVTTVSAKNGKPVIELFVMSYCPYGTQIEKGLLPVLATLGSKVDFQLKFVDYSMHGQKELQENLNQYCIEKNQPNQLQDYLKCFLVAGDSASCVGSAGINKGQMDTCVAQTDSQYKVNYNATNQIGYQGSYPSFNVEQADNVKYNVAGSPTLIINGQEIDSNRDPASLLATICSAFNNKPAECSTVLPSDTPAPGLGTGTVASAAGASSPAQCATQ